MPARPRMRLARYVLAGIFTLLIFALGVLLGLVIEGERIRHIEQVGAQLKLDFISIQVQYAYVNQLGSEQDCARLVKTFDESINNLEAARLKLVSYSQRTQINDEEFNTLKRDYTLGQLQYWLFSRQVKQFCSKDTAWILYFYSTNEKCPGCADQEVVLTYLKKRFGDRLLNFALDSEYQEEPMVQILKSNYDVSRYPTLIIEGTKLEGFSSREQVLAELCRHLQKTGDCEGAAP